MSNFLQRQHGDRSFAISKLAQVSQINLRRLIANDPSQGWSTIVDHLLAALSHFTSSSTNRLQAASSLDEILTASIRSASAHSAEIQSRTQHLVLSSLARQVEPLSSAGGGSTYYQQTDIDIRRLALEALYQILQSAGHEMVMGWERVFACLSSVCRKGGELGTLNEGGETFSLGLGGPPSSGGGRVRQSMSAQGGLGGGGGSRGNASLVRTAFQSVRHFHFPLRLCQLADLGLFSSLSLRSQITLIITDFLLSLSIADLKSCITALADFSRQTDDVNISLSSIGSLWNVSDAVQSRRCGPEGFAYDELWLFIVRELLTCCLDSRAEVRSSAMQTLFRSIELYGSTLDAKLWKECVWEIIFPLLDSLDAFGQEGEHGGPGGMDLSENGQGGVNWDQSKVLALQSVGGIFSSFFLSNLITLPDATNIWKRYLGHTATAFSSGAPPVSTAAVQALSAVLTSWEKSSSADSASDVIQQLISGSWTTWESMGQAVLKAAESVATSSSPTDSETPSPLYKQATLCAFVTTAQPILRQSTSLWSMDRLQHLLVIFKGIMTHPPGDDIRPDVDNLTPLQTAIFDVYGLLDLNLDGSLAVLLEDLSSLITLAYASSHDGEVVAAPEEKGKRPVVRRLTYIAVSKKAMEMAVEVFLAHQAEKGLFAGGTVEHVIKAYSLPVSPASHVSLPSDEYHRSRPRSFPLPDQAQVRLPSIVQVRR